MPTLSALAERAHPVVPPGHTPGFVPSQYQADFFAALLNPRAGDLQVNATAGSGKTKSIEEGAKLLPPELRRKTLLTAFNTHIKGELQTRQNRGGIPREVTIQTIHGLGYGACMRAFQPKNKDLWVNAQKYDRLTDLFWQARTPDLGENSKLRTEAADAMKKLVRLAMLTLTDEDDIPALILMAIHFGIEVPDAFGKVVFGGIAQVLRWGREGLPAPDRVGFTYHPSEFVSFEDMVYLPVKLHLPVPQFMLCFIDECLPYQTPIHLANGDSLPIGDIVEGKLPVEVLAYDTVTGEQRACKVTGWSKTPNRKPLVKIRASWRRDRSTVPSNFVVCTTDHKIWVRDTDKVWKWIEAGQVKARMAVQVETGARKSQAYKITAVQKTEEWAERLNGSSECKPGTGDCPTEAIVTSVETATISDYFVYDITVEDCHNFYANGILVHNCQDFNAAQLALLLMTRDKGGRTIFIGDKNQAIYGFSGADADSFDRIQAKTGATRLPLSICYRCAKSIVRLAQVIVPGIEPDVNAPEGLVQSVGDDNDLLQLAEDHYNDSGRADQTLLLLCRTNAPLIGAALALIRRGIPVTVKGRDIGQQLARTIEDIAKLPDFAFADFPQFAKKYEAIRFLALAGRDGMEMQIAAVQDIIASCYAIFSAAKKQNLYDVSGMVSYVRSLFDDNSDRQIILSSIHKAKGLEADRVGILSSDLMPHPMAKSGWQYRQEENLIYVAVTRARLELYLSGISSVLIPMGAAV